MEKNFDLFMSQLKETNQTLDFFCDFGKIEANIEEIKLSLCMLNSLIGSTDLRKSVEAIWKRDKTAFNVMEILIAVRSKDKKKALDPRGCYVTLNSFLSNIDGIIDFLNQTGLAEVLCKRKIKDLVDYVFGIETGLDSNARKNRSGKIMEATIANIFKIHGVTYRQEIYSNKWHDITKALGTDKKRFDFVIETQQKTYLIEVNFYSDGGSKLNEVARSYSEIAPKINAISGFEFVWITDGIGWKSARNKLQEAYGIIPSIYNLTNISDFINIIKS
ncbi:MAG: type II restriction endonuclease [Alloprevotella tannerae]|jgi:DpnII restriction endonuclease.|uniref:type II restriction endonuclease n=1 Tax=Alloprevotella tannerae TaxID=76122 RepID=UPI0028E84E56|nr:type II restriction endonuclease [Alloprevotella tannerae]